MKMIIEIPIANVLKALASLSKNKALYPAFI